MEAEISTRSIREMTKYFMPALAISVDEMVGMIDVSGFAGGNISVTRYYRLS